MPGKRILVIFPYGNLVYSPTIKNLCKLLSARGHNVRIVYGFQESFGAETPSLDGVELQNVFYSERTIWLARRVDKYIWSWMCRFLQDLSPSGVYVRLTIREILFSRIIKKALRTNTFDELIVVDILPLFWAQRMQIACHFVSLEVGDGLQLIRFLETSRIKSVLIQSQERFRRLFDDSQIRRFFVQNTPNFVESTKRTRASANLIYNGTAWAPFGVIDLVEFVKKYPEYRLHFKGSVDHYVNGLLKSRYRALLDSGVVSCSEAYLDDIELRDYLADYSIGFCLYDFDDPFIAQRRFNYETAPSGKVFLYLSVGMPVIATRITAFRFFEKKRAGILIENHKPETIKNAVDTILENYKEFSDNALAIGKGLSFDEAAKPFIDFVSQ